MVDDSTSRCEKRKAAGSRLEVALGSIAAALLFALVAITCLDVVGRYFFNAPLKGAFELTELMLAALVFSALPLTTQRQEHIEVDLLVTNLGHWLQSKLAVLAHVFSAALLMSFSWRLLVVALRITEDGATTNALHIPLSPIAYLASASCLISAIVSLLLIFERPSSASAVKQRKALDD